MSKWIQVASTLAVGGLLVSGSALADTFRWANSTDPQTMDPHAVNAAPVTSFLNNVYEGLVRRDKDMAIEPSLAVSWEPLEETTGWRFHLREGVKYHNGNDFTADDVLFSYERGVSETSDVSSWFSPVSEVIVVDDYTVDFITHDPNPLFPDSIANFLIMDRDWTKENNAELPAREQETHASRNTNGTGPFRLTQRDPGVETRLKPFDGWWGEVDHNITEAIFTPISNPSTGLAALLSGEIDFISPIPLQDIDQVESRDGFKVLSGIETRVIMLGFGHNHEQLNDSDDVEGENPFQDVRVRQAAWQAINIDAINRVVMRGQAEPASQLMPPGLSGYSEANDERLSYDPEAARELLAKAGYPDGFSFGFKCTNDRYLNDESVCRAISSMFAAVGLDADLTTMPVRNYWDELRSGEFDIYLLGWSPGTFDAEHPIRFLAATPDGRVGSWNFGGYSNERIDELLPKVQQELDPEQRQDWLDEIAGILQDEVAYVPLYTQPLIWAVKENIDLVQRPDDFFMLRWVTIN